MIEKFLKVGGNSDVRVVILVNVVRELSALEKTRIRKQLESLDPHLVRDFKELFDVVDNEVMIYVTLLVQDGLRAREISDVTGIQRTRIYSYLSNLIRKKFIEEKKGKVNLYYVTDPLVLEDYYKEQFKEEFNRKTLMLHRLMYSFLKIWRDAASNSGERDVQVGIESSFPELFEAIGTCSRRIWIAITGKGGVYHWPETTGLLVDALKRGVDIRYYTNKPYLKDVLKSRVELASKYQGVQVFFSSRIPHSFVIVDNVLFFLLDNDTDGKEEPLLLQKVTQVDVLLAYERLCESFECEYDSDDASASKE